MVDRGTDSTSSLVTSSDEKKEEVNPATDLAIELGVADANYVEFYEPTYYSWLCCTHYKDRSKFQNLLHNINLSRVQKQIIKTRYLNILENFQKRARNYGIVFYIGHMVITVGSLFVPALLSIQNSDKSYVYQNGNFTIHIYWATFILSLLVTIFNGILTLFKIDKKYYFLNTTLERLRTEGWQYFSLTGRYSGQLLKKTNPRLQPTHKNQFIHFTHYIEKIKMKQVEEEYFKTDEHAAQTPSKLQQQALQVGVPVNENQNKPDIFSPSPDLALDAMAAAVPEPVQRTVNSMVRSHTMMKSESTTNLQEIKQTPLHSDAESESYASSYSHTPSLSQSLSHRDLSSIPKTPPLSPRPPQNTIIMPPLPPNPLYKEQLETHVKEYYNKLHSQNTPRTQPSSSRPL